MHKGPTHCQTVDQASLGVSRIVPEISAEAEGLEPPRACARLISNQLPYQLDYASNEAKRVSLQSGRQDLNLRPLRPERSALPG